MKLNEFENTIEEVFKESKVRVLDNVYELSKNGEFYKLVYSIHSLNISKTEKLDEVLLHTKFTFKVNLSKTKLTDNYFYYLKDINCNYSKVDFRDSSDLSEKLKKILHERNFGKDILNLSQFISKAPTTTLNYNISSLGIDNVFIYGVLYEPKYKIRPCDEMTFDFTIKLEFSKISLSIKKVESEYFFYYNYLGESFTKIEPDLEVLPYKISTHISNVLN